MTRLLYFVNIPRFFVTHRLPLALAAPQPITAAAPALDWRIKGVVGPVRQQGGGPLVAVADAIASALAVSASWAANTTRGPGGPTGPFSNSAPSRTL